MLFYAYLWRCCGVVRKIVCNRRKLKYFQNRELINVRFIKQFPLKLNRPCLTCFVMETRMY